MISFNILTFIALNSTPWKARAYHNSTEIILRKNDLTTSSGPNNKLKQ